MLASLRTSTVGAMAWEETEIETGRVAGRRVGGVTRFVGIPYASDTGGVGRFAPAGPVAPWTGVRRSDQPGPYAPQRAPSILNSTWLGLGRGATGEDCLSLQVTTPSCTGGRRPVMVWLHGGAFVFGAGSSPLYRGDALVRDGGVVVVTLNYRLGALGFLGFRLGDEFGAPNLGLRDQVAALAWVKRNIAAFGGDPAEVTLFGESAGAMSVAALLGVPEARPLFRRAVLQSGAAHHVSSPARARRMVGAWFDAASLAPTDTRGLRELGTSRVLEAQRAVAMKMGFEAGRLPWQPVVDGEWLAEHPLDALRRGALADKEIVIGTNADEWKLFTLGQRKLLKLDVAGLRHRLHAVLQPLDDARDWVDRAEKLYLARTEGKLAAPLEAWCAFQRDRVFAKPALELARAHSETGGRTFLYRFDWRHPLLRDRLGACHGIDVPFVFGALRRGPFLPIFAPAAAAHGTSRAVVRAWTRFATEGDPGLLGVPWTTFTKDSEMALSIGRGPAMVTHSDPETLRYQEELAARLAQWEGQREAEEAQ